MDVPALVSGPADMQPLSFLWLEITGRCNLECVHCYADSGPSRPLRGAMCAEDWCAVLAEGASLGCRSVQFIGGEPLLHPDFPRLVARAREEGFAFVEVYTNATVLREDLLQCLASRRVSVAFSLYSDDPATHDRVTGRNGSFNRTVRGVEKLLAAGVKLRAGIVETERNRGHAGRARRFLARLGVTTHTVDGERPVGRSTDRTAAHDPFAALCGACRHGRLCVTPSGSVYPCVFARRFELGDARGGLGPILAGPALAAFRAAGSWPVALHAEHAWGAEAARDSCDPVSCSPPPPFCLPGCAPVVPGRRDPREIGRAG